MRVASRVKLSWLVQGVLHVLDTSGPVPVLRHGTQRGWFSRPCRKQMRQFRRDMLRAGIEVYYG